MDGEAWSTSALSDFFYRIFNENNSSPRVLQTSDLLSMSMN